MSDIALTWDTQLNAADFEVEANDLESTDDLQTAVLISLFVDSADADYPGWWGDNVPSVEGDKIGSRLWTLARRKKTSDLLTDAKQIVEEALAWMVEDKVLDLFAVTTEFLSNGWLAIGLTLYRPDESIVNFRYNYAWAAQEARIA